MTNLDEVALLTVKEVATVLRVSAMTVGRLIADGKLQSIRVGKQHRVPEESLHEYLEGARRLTELQVLERLLTKYPTIARRMLLAHRRNGGHPR